MTNKMMRVTSRLLLAIGLVAAGCTKELVKDAQTSPSASQQATVVIPPSGGPSTVVVPPGDGQPPTVVVPSGGPPPTVVTAPKEQMTHCSGNEWADNSSVAYVPIPGVAFVSPHTDLNEIKADDYLKRCGEPQKLINRKVVVSKNACIPAGLTRIITLGVWQWCPVEVFWEADRLG